MTEHTGESDTGGVLKAPSGGHAADPLRVSLQRRPAKASISEWWRIATAVAVALVLGLGALAVLDAVGHILAMLALGISVAVAMSPIAAWLQRWLPRAFAVILTYFILVAVLVVLGGIVLPTVVRQGELLGEQLPTYADQITQWLARRRFIEGDMMEQLQPVQRLIENMSVIGGALFAVPMAVFSSLADFLFVVFVSIYWLILMPQMRTFMRSLFPSHQSERVCYALSRMGEAMGGYVRGVAIDAVAVGVFMYIGLLIIGVDFPAVLGIIAGLFEVIPVVGPIIAGVPIVIVALLESPQKALITVIFILVTQQLEANILLPTVMKGQAHISPLLSLMAVFTGGAVGGILGALVAVPLAAALQAFVQVVGAPAIRRLTGAPPPEAEEAAQET